LASSVKQPVRAVYLDYTQDELDRAYTQSAWADNVAELLEGWARRGPSCRTPAFGHTEEAYGPDGCERVDLFGASGPVVHLHLHGGAWQRQSKEDCSFMAPAMGAIGVPFVVPEFGRLPDYRMPEVRDQIARALVWTYRRFVASGPAEGIVVSGHSSGAHMAALMAAHDFGDALPVHALRAVLCLSGPYDLEPVMLSSRRSYIHLTAEEQDELSPIRRVGDMRVPLHLIYGGRESPEFIRQSRAFASALAREGRLAALVEVPDANHFEVADQLGTLDTPVGRWLHALLAMPHRTDDLPATGAVSKKVLGKPGGPMTPRLRHIALRVRDIETSARFYETVFGFERVGREEIPIGAALYLSDGVINLALINYFGDEGAATDGASDSVGTDHFGVQVDDVDAMRERIEAAGGTFYFDLGDARKGNFERKFKDPDGIVFDISHHGWLGTDSRRTPEEAE